jgi:hypothetical protein
VGPTTGLDAVVQPVASRYPGSQMNK